MLLDDGGRPWLIDFDEATIAPREVDLMLVELGVMFDAPSPRRTASCSATGYGRDVRHRPRARHPLRVRPRHRRRRLVFSRRPRRDPADPAPFRMLDGILGPHGLVTLVEKELERLPHSPTLADTKEER